MTFLGTNFYRKKTMQQPENVQALPNHDLNQGYNQLQGQTMQSTGVNTAHPPPSNNPFQGPLQQPYYQASIPQQSQPPFQQTQPFNQQPPQQQYFYTPGQIAPLQQADIKAPSDSRKVTLIVMTVVSGLISAIVTIASILKPGNSTHGRRQLWHIFAVDNETLFYSDLITIFLIVLVVRYRGLKSEAQKKSTFFSFLTLFVVQIFAVVVWVSINIIFKENQH